MKSFWTRCERFPPLLCRLLARDGSYGPPLTSIELAQRTGLSEFEILTLSDQVDWRGVDIYTMRKFTEACGLDFTDRVAMKRVHTYLKGKTVAGQRVAPRFGYLRKSPLWQTLYEPLIRKLCARKNSQRKDHSAEDSSSIRRGKS